MLVGLGSASGKHFRDELLQGSSTDSGRCVTSVVKAIVSGPALEKWTESDREQLVTRYCGFNATVQDLPVCSSSKSLLQT